MAEKKAVTFIVNQDGNNNKNQSFLFSLLTCEHIFCLVWEIIVSVSSWRHTANQISFLSSTWLFVSLHIHLLRFVCVSVTPTKPTRGIYSNYAERTLVTVQYMSHQDYMRLWIQRCTFYSACKRVLSTLVINPYDMGSYFFPMVLTEIRTRFADFSLPACNNCLTFKVRETYNFWLVWPSYLSLHDVKLALVRDPVAESSRSWPSFDFRMSF